MRVLVIEDDPLLGDALAVGLPQRGFEADWVQDGRDAQTAVCVEPFAAIVLDLGLPGLSGLELLRSERARGNKVPVLVLTARDAVQNRITDAGPGVSAEQQANIGRRFYRAPGTQAPGSGLGLSIVQRVIDLHRGTMRLDSPSTGVGLQVSIELPRVRGSASDHSDRRLHVVL